MKRLAVFAVVSAATIMIIHQLRRTEMRVERAFLEVNGVNEALQDTLARQAFIVEANAALASSPDSTTALASVARLAVPRVADYCVVYLRDGAGVRALAAFHRDPEKLAVLEEIHARYPWPVDAPHGYPAVMRTGELELLPAVPDQILEDMAEDEEHLQLMRRLEFGANLCVPLLVNGAAVGAINLGMSGSGRGFAPGDVKLAEDLARRASIAIEQTRLRSEQDAARERFRIAAAGARLGTWEWDLGTSVIWSESLEAIYGFAPGAYPGTFEAFIERVHPDDRQFLSDNISVSLASGADSDFEHRIVLPDGAVRWLNGRGRVFRDEAGKPVRMIGVGIDITERKEAQTELERIAQLLAIANAAKDEFLGLVSHELRTPITTIFGNARVLRSHAQFLDEEDRATALEDIEIEADRLQRIIENLLILARFQATDVIETEPIMVAEKVGSIVDNTRRRLRQRDIRVDIAPGVMFGSAQPTYFELVLSNLLSNADKYSPPDAPIEVEVKRDGPDVSIEVRDHGEGILPDEVEELFSPFYRATRTKQLAGGMGIGLAVCKRIIEAQGSRIWAQRRPEGGAAFGFTIPAEDVEV